MTNTKAGGLAIKQTMVEKYGSEEAFRAHMSEIAKLGKGIKRPGAGFASNHEAARTWGAVGGRVSRKRKVQEATASDYEI
jgi:hypothetical protein